ncbi:Glucose-1-phosphate adenylyltransferase large subunit 2, chloroplastic [Vitis vinifera]|uniref:Glucose-1-phosphate adenylyltransferase large subunit 2, chloroplastic n=1 Tax=Vitis vinifera TaxID=29760 RepID=A0A438BNI3_VITVI|nr:Glucose-1-phosphate adenylyltransferase large subunit 2, chloroplastic [Vitis vinifera]
MQAPIYSILGSCQPTSRVHHRRRSVFRDLVVHSNSRISGNLNIWAPTKGSSAACLLADVYKDFMTLDAPELAKPEADPKRCTWFSGANWGCYRLIDVPMSNCINSGINKIYILTQFNSQSLNRHIARTYNLGSGVNFGDGFVEVLAATQTSGESGKKWFQGTADAVRQFIWLFEDARHRHIENILILSGDHLYRMDYMEFVQKHIDSDADISVSCLPMDESRASDFGLIKIDEMGQIQQFLEKPKGETLKSMRVDTTALGLSPVEAKKFPYIASMGIYLFKTDVLLKLLRWSYPTANDFGSEVIPMAAEECNVQAYLFNGYWEDIGTIKSFFDANLALTDQPPKFHFYDPLKPIFTSPLFLPPTKIEKCRVMDSIISHGCFLRECSVEHSIVGIRSRLDYGVEMKVTLSPSPFGLDPLLIKEGSRMFILSTSMRKDTMMMGADYYQTEEEIAAFLAEGKVPIGVGKGTKIMNCIIDKNARIGKNVVITNKDKVEEADRPSEGFYIRSGITVVLKNSVIMDETII